LLISTGNIDNTRLIALLGSNLAALVDAFDVHRFVEITQDILIIHE